MVRKCRVCILFVSTIVLDLFVRQQDIMSRMGFQYEHIHVMCPSNQSINGDSFSQIIYKKTQMGKQVSNTKRCPLKVDFLRQKYCHFQIKGF